MKDKSLIKGVYLGAYKARHPNYNLIYNDIDPKTGCDLICDMLDVDLAAFDYILCTPPCNWWSKTNYRNYCSEYALRTRHLLPIMLMRLAALKKPFLIENVKNNKRYIENGIFRICEKYNIFWQIVGRHIYFSNVFIDLNCPQQQDFRYGGVRVNNDGHNQGGSNVSACFEIWLDYVVNNYDFVRWGTKWFLK